MNTRSFYSTILQEARACLTLAIPLSLAQLLEISMLSVDTWTMGMLGSKALAGGALGYMTFRFLFTLGIYTLSAVNTIASIAFGSRQFDKLKGITTQGFYLALLLALPMMLILSSAPLWMNFLHQEKMVIYQSQSYLKAVLWGLPALFCFEVLRNVLIAVNSSVIIPIILVSSIPINAVGNYIFAFGKLGFPELGIAGIGWSTALVLWIQLLVILSFTYLSPKLKSYKLLSHNIKSDPSIFQELIRVGSASGLLYISAGGLAVVSTYLMGSLGTVPLAAFQIANQVRSMIRAFTVGLAQSITARVAQMYGEEDVEKVRISGFVGMMISVLFALTFLLLVALGRTYIVSLFLKPESTIDLEVFDLSMSLLLIVASMQLFNEIDTAATGALLGIKDTFQPMLIGLLGYWGLGLGSICLMLFKFHLGASGVMIGLHFGVFIQAVVFPLRFYAKTTHMLPVSSTLSVLKH
ncbi:MULTISPECIES: MATE family efflux transporter [Kamptonema]|uniref:MATE family efflux transporter n=1 Tax=Kamptonema TaxID=1501433 RepID=UPI0001DACE1A|nr:MULTISPECIES: MATE family efflux transporter [Kamptonema]CBN58163.1 putative MatE efflux transporter [Kamptonema sp. PCC 6506]